MQQQSGTDALALVLALAPALVLAVALALVLLVLHGRLRAELHLGACQRCCPHPEAPAWQLLCLLAQQHLQLQHHWHV